MAFPSQGAGEPGSPFSVALARDRGRARLYLAGELDATVVPWLCGRLDDLLTTGRRLRTVSVDLSGLTFVDVAGARALTAVHQWLVGHSKHVEVIGMSAQVRRVLDLTGDEFQLGKSSPEASEPPPGTDLLQHRGAG